MYSIYIIYNRIEPCYTETGCVKWDDPPSSSGFATLVDVELPDAGKNHRTKATKRAVRSCGRQLTVGGTVKVHQVSKNLWSCEVRHIFQSNIHQFKNSYLT